MNYGKEPKEGVYLTKLGMFKIVKKLIDDNGVSKWEVDEGKMIRHPVLGVSVPSVESSWGNYFVNRAIRNCEFLGEL
jgi:hypothetical protein